MVLDCKVFYMLFGFTTEKGYLNRLNKETGQSPGNTVEQDLDLLSPSRWCNCMGGP